MRLRISALLLMFLMSTALGAGPGDYHFGRDGDAIRVFLITGGPGEEPWEKFGHCCIEISDPELHYVGTDRAFDASYNWGVFSFGTGVSGFTSFAAQFLRGRLWYSMEADATQPLLGYYKQAGRSLSRQELNLTGKQKLDLEARLASEDTEANRHYLYDYYLTNCSTKARDAIDKTVGGRVFEKLKDVPTDTTYRWHNRRLSADQTWLFGFLEFILGHPVDHKLSAWEECYLPEKLAMHLKSVMVKDETGKMVPIVMNEEVLNTGRISVRSEPPMNYLAWALGTGLVSAGLLATLAVSGRRLWPLRWMFNLAGIVWSLVVGLLGALSTYAWFSNHTAAKWNENWLQGSPLSLLLVVLIPAAFWWPRAARSVSAFVLALSVVGLGAKLVPAMNQSNLGVIAVMLPVHAAIAFGIRRANKLKETIKSSEPVAATSDLPAVVTV